MRIGRRRESRFDVLSSHDREGSAFAAGLQRIKGEDGARENNGRKNNQRDESCRTPAQKEETRGAKEHEPERNGCSDGILGGSSGLDVTLDPISLQLQGARFITHQNQIRRGFRMMWIERERAFVVQDCLAKISEPEPRIAQIVEQICAPLPGLDENLVTVDRLLEMPFAVILVRLRERWILICASGSRGRAT